MNDQPKRITLSRKKGAKLPENTVVVTRPSRWGNPFMVGNQVRNAQQAVAAFAHWLWHEQEGRALLADVRRELRGKNLACWCQHDCDCHADVLLAVANAPD